jgi:hypothetical protein
MEHINFRWEYPHRRNNILQVGGSIHQEGTVYFRWDYPPSTPQLGVFIQMEHINFSWEYLPQMEQIQYTSGRSIHPVLLIWEYPLRWNTYSILEVGVSTQNSSAWSIHSDGIYKN